MKVVKSTAKVAAACLPVQFAGQVGLPAARQMERLAVPAWHVPPTTHAFPSKLEPVLTPSSTRSALTRMAAGQNASQEIAVNPPVVLTLAVSCVHWCVGPHQMMIPTERTTALTLEGVIARVLPGSCLGVVVVTDPAANARRVPHSGLQRVGARILLALEVWAGI